MPPDAPDTSPDSSFFNGRFLIEIEEWNWALYMGLSHPSTPPRYRFQGGLMYTRGIEIAGRIRAPSIRRGTHVQVFVSTFGRRERFNPRSGDVGRFYTRRLGEIGSPFEMSLRLPEDALSNALICLGSIWKFLDVWTATDEADSAITAFCFSAAIHPNIAEWAGSAMERPSDERP
jgi:hypothetical protein